MTEQQDTYVNAVGRIIPKYIPNYGETRPFAGAFATAPREGVELPTVHRAFIKPGDTKIRDSLTESLREAGIASGMTISFHHHLRNGDQVAAQIFKSIEEIGGLKNLEMAPSSVHPVHKGMIPLIKSGVVTKIHTGTNGAVGKFVSEGGMEGGVVVVRSHGARVRAIRDGDIKIDIAVIAASASDIAGNCTGIVGPSACGPLAYAAADAMYAKHVIVVTDNIVEYPCTPVSIKGIYVNQVVVVPNIGDPKKIVSTTMRMANTEPGLTISANAAKVIGASGIMKPGFSFQAGAGGSSLLSIKYILDEMRAKGVKAAWANGGTTKLIVDAYKEGLVKKISTCQAFDIPSIRSMSEDAPDHFEIDIDQYANPYNGGCVVHKLDVCILGALEIDVNFNLNSNVRSNGYMMHNTGGSQDTAAGSSITVITCPAARGSNPSIVDAVSCCTTPGECVDVVVTEEGVAVNPLRPELREALSAIEGIELHTIEELRDIAYAKAGRKHSRAETGDRIIGVIEWRDGTVIDVVREVKHKLPEPVMKLKSDCLVEITPKEEGGITTEVIHAFRDGCLSVEQQEVMIREIAESLHIADKHMHVKVYDVASFDWSFAARVEAAMKSMFPECEKHMHLLPLHPKMERPQFPRDNPLRRSLLYVPGNNPYMLAKAGQKAFEEADCIIYDLEDAVAPAKKDAGRILVRNALRALPFGPHTEAQVRINQGPRGMADLEQLVPHSPVNVICIPKIERPEQLIAMQTHISKLAAGGDTPWIIGLIESGFGVEFAFQIAQAGTTEDGLLVGLSMGLEDYSKDIGAQRTKGGLESAWAQARVHNASAAFQLQSFDSVFADFSDSEGLALNVQKMRDLGYVGKRLIHPSQIAVVNKHFAPPQKALDYAKRVVEAAEKAKGGAIALGNKMIDLPVLQRAQRAIRMAKAMGLIE